MKLYQFPIPIPMTNGNYPNLKFMISGDNLATVTTAGYLNDENRQTGVPLDSKDVIMALYGFNQQTQAGTFGIFTPSFSNNVITLNIWANPGDVLLPVVSGDFANFNGTSGQIKDAGYSPTNAAKTKVVMADAATTLNNWAMFTDTAGTIGNILKANGTEAANAVTASGKAGVITTSSLSTAAGGSYAITWTNTQIDAASAIQLSLMGGTNTIKNIQFQATAGVGTSTLTIYNNDPLAALDGTVLLAYQVV